MSFWIRVNRPDDETNKIPLPDIIPYGTPVTEDELLAHSERWAEYGRKVWWYREFLGGDHTVGAFWSTPASQLGLPMLTSLYENGLVLETPEQLEQLVQELDVLQTYWDTHIPSEEREFLQEGMGYLREAICIAKDKDAQLGIA